MTFTLEKIAFDEYPTYSDGTNTCYELVEGAHFYEYRSKPSKYALLEIPEYWILDPLELKVTVCILDYRVYDCTEFEGDSLVQSSIFPEIELTAIQILFAKR